MFSKQIFSKFKKEKENYNTKQKKQHHQTRKTCMMRLVCVCIYVDVTYLFHCIRI